MAEFNIQNSKIEQLNDTGGNYKVSSNSGAVGQNVNQVQNSGTINSLSQSAGKDKSLIEKIWGWIKKAWLWIKGRFV